MLQLAERKLDRPLTARELEIVDWASYGYTCDAIGQELGISVNTVKTHLKNIAKNMGVGDRGGIVGYAYRNGIL